MVEESKERWGGEEDRTVLEQATMCWAPSFAVVVTHRPSTVSGHLIVTVLCGTPASSTPLHLPSAPSFPPVHPSLRGNSDIAFPGMTSHHPHPAGRSGPLVTLVLLGLP